MPVSVDVQLDEETMVEYMLYRIYTGGVGIICVVLGVLNIGLVFAFGSRRDWLLALVFGLFAVILLLVFPLIVRRRVAAQLKGSKRLQIPVTYEFSAEGVLTSTGGKSGQASWKAFAKAVSRKKIIILFDQKKQAIILPIAQLGEQYTPVVDLIFAHMPAPAVRINRRDKRR